MSKKIYVWVLYVTVLLTIVAFGFHTKRDTEERLPKVLSEVVPAGKAVLVDGVRLPSLDVNGEAYVRLDQLQEQLPWLEMTESDAGCSFSLRDSSEPVTLPSGSIEDYRNEVLESHACIRCEDGCYLPVEALASGAGMRSLSDDDAIYVSSVVMNGSTLPTGVSVPVLMYHAFSDDIWGELELFVSADVFRQQMQYLLDAGYEPIFFEDLYHFEDYVKPILITVDDGYKDNYEDLFPVVQELGIKITLNLIAGNVDSTVFEMFMSSEQVKEMSDSGLVSIQSHTMSHANLEQADEETTRFEMSESQKAIAKLTGKIPYLLSCPESRTSDLTYQIVPEYYSFMTVAGTGLTWPIDNGAYHINRTSIHRSLTLDEFASMYP